MVYWTNCFSGLLFSGSVYLCPKTFPSLLCKHLWIFMSKGNVYKNQFVLKQYMGYPLIGPTLYWCWSYKMSFYISMLKSRMLWAHLPPAYCSRIFKTPYLGLSTKKELEFCHRFCPQSCARTVKFFFFLQQSRGSPPCQFLLVFVIEFYTQRIRGFIILVFGLHAWDLSDLCLWFKNWLWQIHRMACVPYLIHDNCLNYSWPKPNSVISITS